MKSPEPFAKLLFLLDSGADSSIRQKVIRRLSLDFSPVEREYALPDGQVWLSLEMPVSLSEIPDVANYLDKISSLICERGSESRLTIYYVTETRIVSVKCWESNKRDIYIGSGVYGNVVAWASAHASGFTFPDDVSGDMKEAAEFINTVRSDLVDSQVRGKLSAFKS